MNKIEKKFNIFELLNTANYFAKERKEREKNGGNSKFGCFPPKVQYAISSNIKTIEETIRPFIEIRKEMTDNIKEKYFDDEHSEEHMIDDQNVRKVKEEYMSDYTKDINEVNKKLNDFMMEKIDLNLFEIDMENLMDNLPEDASISMEDIEVLSVFEK